MLVTRSPAVRTMLERITQLVNSVVAEVDPKGLLTPEQVVELIGGQGSDGLGQYKHAHMQRPSASAIEGCLWAQGPQGPAHSRASGGAPR